MNLIAIFNRALRVTSWSLAIVTLLVLFSGYVMTTSSLASIIGYSAATMIRTYVVPMIIVPVFYFYTIAGLLFLLVRNFYGGRGVSKASVSVLFTLMFASFFVLSYIIFGGSASTITSNVTSTAMLNDSASDNNAISNQIILNPEEVAKHSVQSDCWMIVRGKIYDFGAFLSQYNVSASIMTPYCGKEGTSAFAMAYKSNSSYAYGLLNSYFIGDLVSSKPSVNATKVDAVQYGSSGQAASVAPAPSVQDSPSVTQNSTSCVPNWSNGSWSACLGGSQNRTVADLNNCSNTTGQPATIQSCAMPACTPRWSTGSWSTCVNNTQSRSVTDTNNCGNSTGKPSATRACTSPVCTPSWTIGSWSTCANSVQTRTVTDSNNCGNNTGKPATNQTCIMSVCTPNWVTGSWSTCVSGSQTRTVTDSNNCGNSTGKPSTVQTCTMPVCTPYWSTGSWSTCAGGLQTRTVTDLNGCGNNTGKPATSQSCTIPVCTPSWTIGSWSTCANSIQTRTVTDSNNCGNSTGKPATSQSCIMPVCTPNWVTGSWSACVSGTQTRAVTDSNNCGNSTGKPATSQTCTGSDPTPVPRSTPDTINFAGYTWYVRSSSSSEEPGPNMWSNSADSIWVDTAGRLHLTIRKIGNTWYSSEVGLMQSMGFGKYVFMTQSSLDKFDTNIIPAFFLYKNDNSELDIEYGTWSGETVDNVLFSAQPDTSSKTHSSFTISSASGNYLSNIIDWTSSRVVYQVLDGQCTASTQSNVRGQWTYTGSNNPQTTDGQVAIINLWLYNGAAPTNGQGAELIVSNFTFIPNGS